MFKVAIRADAARTTVASALEAPEVPTFARTHEGSMSASKADRFNMYLPAGLEMLIHHGPACLAGDKTDSACIEGSASITDSWAMAGRGPGRAAAQGLQVPHDGPGRRGYEAVLVGPQ
jgi:hypothetical protein